MRRAIRAEVQSIAPLDEVERETVEQVLRWVDSGASLCRIEKPATPPRHLVSYFVLVDGDHVLLVDHINAERWLPTGGHVEPGEHPRDTVRREVREELGIEHDFLFAEPLLISSVETVGKTAHHTDVSLWYALRGDREQALRYDASEFHSVRWFHRDAIPFGQSDPHMRRFLEKLALRVGR
ncbi:MAG: NUDIX hydrolase [Myxococcales bacterium]|nr:NUDIX hydrolase [Myxococcales bacterium]